jgi:hypothetical protein
MQQADKIGLGGMKILHLKHTPAGEKSGAPRRRSNTRMER